MIKTTIAGEALTVALERQQRFFRQHGEDAGDELQDLKRAQLRETDTLKRENTDLQRRLRMAKAGLRSETP